MFLPGHRNLSANTISSYRDTFKLLLLYAKDCKGILPEKLILKSISKDFVLDFLSWLESDRNNGMSSRNQRLAAIRSFFRYVQSEEPTGIYQFQQIISIKLKKHEKTVVEHLSVEALQLLLLQPNQTKKSGRRDLTVLSLLYDTGARVQELIDLTPGDIRFDAPAVISLTGKGRKTRIVPLMQNTCTLLHNYMAENGLLTANAVQYPLFFNSQKGKLSREGIAYILNKYIQSAQKERDIFPDRVTPHMLRHTKAMHLLQSGINIVYIRDLLGHTDVKTTEIYARLDTEMKRKALEEVYPKINKTDFPEWSADTNLLLWLESL